MRKSVETTLAEGVARAEAAVYKERVRTYWEVGDRLAGYLDTVDAEYGTRTVSRLAEDVNLSRRILYDALKFRRLAPKVPAQAQLTWSHYRRLISVQDASLQQRLLKSARDAGWSLDELNRQIQDAQGRAPSTGEQAGAAELRAKRGELFVYRTIEKHGEVALDLGFRDWRPARDATLSVGDLVRSVPDGRRTTGYRLEPSGLRRRIYAFPARLERIIDGDTIWASIDLGFDTWADRKLRLRGIDAPEPDSAAGVRARDWLAQTLEEAGDFVVTTTKVDLYDRYLADLFVMPGEGDLARVAAEGTYVNRALVAGGLARLWTKEAPPEF